MKQERDTQEQRLTEKKMKCDKIKLEIANANRQLKKDEDTFKKQIEEINKIMVNKDNDAESKVIEKKKDIIITSKTDTEPSIKNVSKSNKFAIYEEEIVKNKN